MSKIEILEQINYSVSFILFREKKIIENKKKMQEFIEKPFYKTIEEAIHIMRKEILIETQVLNNYLKKL